MLIEGDRRVVLGIDDDGVRGDLAGQVIATFEGVQEHVFAYTVSADVPATLLGRLAVDQKYRGQGLGEHMLLHALKRSNDLSCEIASYAVVVDAKDEAVIAFYQHFNFLQFPGTPDRLYLPMKQVAKLF